jgi:ribonuclease-3 family protein
MEESIRQQWDNPVEQAFGLSGQDIRTYSPLVLAFIGDGVYELVIRTILVEQGNTHAHLLHKRCSQFVKAETQAAMIERLLPLLTEEEEAVYRRGRNAKIGSKARSASLADYKKATGFEALMGFLYLSHRMDRLLELVKCGMGNRR